MVIYVNTVNGSIKSFPSPPALTLVLTFMVFTSSQFRICVASQHSQSMSAEVLTRLTITMAKPLSVAYFRRDTLGTLTLE
jgi:hypothetical protein